MYPLFYTELLTKKCESEYCTIFKPNTVIKMLLNVQFNRSILTNVTLKFHTWGSNFLAKHISEAHCSNDHICQGLIKTRWKPRRSSLFSSNEERQTMTDEVKPHLSRLFTHVCLGTNHSYRIYPVGKVTHLYRDIQLCGQTERKCPDKWWSTVKVTWNVGSCELIKL